jgi:hypothetical protein
MNILFVWDLVPMIVAMGHGLVDLERYNRTVLLLALLDSTFRATVDGQRGVQPDVSSRGLSAPLSGNGAHF